MSNQTINPRSVWATIFILAIAAVRVIINIDGSLHPLVNFSPIGAMALFAGACFTNRRAAFAVPLLTLFVSDSILALTVYSKYSNGLLYSGWYWVYGAFALMVVAGKLLIPKISVKNVLVATLAITVIHWVVSDIGVWWSGTTYPRTFAGWMACMAAAIPFERNFLLGTVLYSGILFGGFVWMQRSKPAIARL